MALAIEQTRGIRPVQPKIDAYPGGFLRDGEGYQITISGVNKRVPIDVRPGIKARIPNILLQVTRPFSNGCDTHDNRIKKAFSRRYKGDPEGLLEDNPVQVVAVPRSLSMPNSFSAKEYAQNEAWDLIILDGNGRARWAANYGITNPNCNVQNIHEITKNFHRENFSHVTPAMVAVALKKEADTADGSYLAAKEEPVGCRRGIRYATPRPLSSEELEQTIPGFFAKLQASN